MHCIGSDDEMSQAGDAELRLGHVWEVVGPFPSGMREHPLTASPLHAFVARGHDADLDFARREYDETETWPSELADGGRVGWSKFSQDAAGWVKVAYPHIRWSQLRADRGWASLQYQVLLRSTLHIPPSGSSSQACLRIDARQMVEYALVKDTDDGQVIWHQGDMYDFAGSPRGARRNSPTSAFARSLLVDPGEYTIIARAVYEIRLFGDPIDGPPTIRCKVDVEVDPSHKPRVVEELDIVPDVLGDVFMGDFIAVALHNPASGSPITIVKAREECGSMEMASSSPVRIAPGQTRMVVLDIKPGTELAAGETTLALRFVANDDRTGSTCTIAHHIGLKRHDRVDPPFKFTFASPSKPAQGLPAQIGYAIAIPPRQDEARLNKSRTAPVILALHGAGVDVESDEWHRAIPPTGGWTVQPTGKNEWGEDWHGASMADAWAARDALPVALAKIGRTVSDKTILMGHSNGGQGVWHAAARYPDRVVGVIGASGYVKIQDYVPYAELTGHRHADPALMGLLMASLSGYNNDLHLSNLVGIPCLAFHGGADTNVTPRHSRSYAAVISAWQHQSDAVEVVEVAGEDHWWEGILRHPKIISFIDKLSDRAKPDWDAERKTGFTLTAVTPEENGGRAGIRMIEVDTPGRMARLDVNAPQWRDGSEQPGLDLRGMNVKRISMTSASRTQVLSRQQDGTFGPYRVRASGPMIRILAGTGPMTFVVGDDPRHVRLATRLAQDVFVHHRLDCEILPAYEALWKTARSEPRGNIVVIGRPDENDYARWMMAQKRIPVTFPTNGILQVTDKVVYDRGSGLISLHPHPTNPAGLAVLIAGNDEAGLETAARLFPIRTGVPVPDWVVVGSRMSWQAAGGIIGAGFWDGQWGWSEKMSWFDR